MASEKDIRHFVKHNMPRPENGTAFMEEYRRSIDLLPVPSSMSCRSPEDIDSSIAALKKAAGTLKKRSRITAVAVTLVSIAVLLWIAAAIGSLHHDFLTRAGAFISSHRFFIIVTFAAVVTALSMIAAKKSTSGI